MYTEELATKYGNVLGSVIDELLAWRDDGIGGDATCRRIADIFSDMGAWVGEHFEIEGEA
jgi:hypothetical protein